MGKFKSFNKDTFKEYMDNLKISRKVIRVQLHHTYSPSYKNFTGTNHQALQNNMRNYHVKTNGWNDIGQHFTIFPDGIILTGRSLEKDPAGIYGANSGAICIECLGNFDKGGDTMTSEQKNSVVAVVKILVDRFGLDATDDVIYHAWYGSDGRALGDYYQRHSVKTCPGTNFFGGNTLTAYEKNLKPLIETYGKELNNMVLNPVDNINDIVWELENAGVLKESKKWMKKCEEDKDVYWLCYKIANKLRGTLE